MRTRSARSALVRFLLALALLVLGLGLACGINPIPTPGAGCGGSADSGGAGGFDTSPGGGDAGGGGADGSAADAAAGEDAPAAPDAAGGDAEGPDGGGCECAVDDDCAALVPEGDVCRVARCVACRCVADRPPIPCAADGDCAALETPCRSAGCVGGFCETVTAPPGTPCGAACESDADCDDGDPCTEDACVPAADPARPDAGAQCTHTLAAAQAG